MAGCRPKAEIGNRINRRIVTVVEKRAIDIYLLDLAVDAERITLPEHNVRRLANFDRPDAIFVSTDPMAQGAYRAIAARGLRIPDDVAIVEAAMNQGAKAR